MTLLVLCISLIVLDFGAVGILAPLRLIKFVLWFDNPHGLYAAAAFRIIFGLALIYIAKATQWPEILDIVGLFTLGVCRTFRQNQPDLTLLNVGDFW
jgi:hypothetical protein